MIMQTHKPLITLLLLLLTCPLLRAESRLTIHPQQWWVGMKDPTLQILLYGDELVGATLTVEGDGVTLTETVTPPNPRYRLLYLDLSSAVPQDLRIRIRGAEGDERTISYPLLKRQRQETKAQGFSPEDVLYLIMPDRFANGDPTNDTIEGMRETRVDRSNGFARHGGDLKGLKQSLPYLSDLGVTALWLNPVQENDMSEGSYHGYAITDYYRIDRRLGSNEDFRHFVQAAHERGLKVIMDMVFNHCGSESPLFRDMPGEDWFHHGSQYHQTSFKTSTQMDPNAPKSELEEATDGWFVETMPDLNHSNPHVMTYLTQSSIYWIEYAGIDGIRQDTHPFGDLRAMGKWCDALLEEYPDFNIVGETWFKLPSQVAYWQRGSRLARPEDSRLPTVMDFPLMLATTRAFDEETTPWDGGLFHLYECLSADFVYEDRDRLLTFLDNHDTSRFCKDSTDAANLSRYRQALAFLLTTRGIPQLYYGTEILMAADKSEGDGALRQDFPGGWAGDSTDVLRGKGLSPTQQEALAYTRRLLTWRRGNKTVTRGKLRHYSPRDGVYIYTRSLDGSYVVVLLNGTSEERHIALRALPLPEGVTIDREVISGRVFPRSETTLLLPPHDVMILE